MSRANPFENSIFGNDLTLKPTVNLPLYPTQQSFLKNTIEIAIEGSENQQSRILMLSSPEAGQGKSHLLAQAFSDTASISTTVQVDFCRESTPTWKAILNQTLSFLSKQPISGNHASLSKTARHLFSELICELIRKSIVPVENTPIAVHGLQLHYTKMFDLKDRSSLIGEWFKENIALLFPHFANSLSRKTGLTITSSEFWIELLYRHELNGPGPAITEFNDITEAQAKLQTQELSQIVNLYLPLIFAFDHLDCFYQDPKRGLEAARLFSEIVWAGITPLVIVIMNDDLWESTFVSALPSAIKDRLNEHSVRLEGITLNGARDLIKERMRDKGIEEPSMENLIQRVNLEHLYQSNLRNKCLSPRQILRLASAEWKKDETLEACLDQPARQLSATESEYATPANETLGRIQEMLKEVNQRVLAKAKEPAPKDNEIVLSSPWDAPDKNAPAVIRNFAKQREELYSGKQSLFDTEAIRYTLELVGKRSPLIDYQEFDIDDGSAAASWRSTDMEILFGFEPAERVPYWRALVDQASDSPIQDSKVVAFTSTDSPSFGTEELNENARERLDVLELDRGALASIVASNAVVKGSDSKEEIFSQIAPELEFLWRRITRPIQSVS